MDTYTEALDVWLRFAEPDDEESESEANTYRSSDGFVVEWYHTAVGQVSSRSFTTRKQARDFLTSEGFEDYTS